MIGGEVLPYEIVLLKNRKQMTKFYKNKSLIIIKIKIFILKVITLNIKT